MLYVCIHYRIDKKKKKVSENFGEDNEKDIGEEQSFYLYCQVPRSRRIIPSAPYGVIFFSKKIKQKDFHKMQRECTYLSYCRKLTTYE